MKTFLKAFLLLLTIAAVLFVSLSLGTRIISPSEMLEILTGDVKGIDYSILFRIRLPRIFLALVIGSSLAVSGTVFQAVLKNPLADPYIIGVSGGAALGATIGIISTENYYIIALSSFGGSIGVIILIYMFSMRIRLGTTAIILSGIALGFICSAAVLLIFAVSKSEQVHKAVMWLMGDLSMARYNILGMLSIVSLLLISIVIVFHKHLDIISFGERFSWGLGVSQMNIRILFFVAALLPAISVSMAGVIGFVGLIVPHVIRIIFGPRHLGLVPLTAVGGALFLLVSDTIARTIAPPYEIPVGIVTSFFGGIFFLVFMLKRGRTS